MDEYKSRLSTYLSDMVREELEKYDGGFTDEMNDQRGKNAEVLGYKLSGTSDVKEAKKPVSFKLGGVTFGKDYQGLKSRNGGIRYYYQKGTGSKNMESDFGKFIVKVGGLVSSSDKNKVAKKLKEVKLTEKAERDYKDEYKKFQSSDKSKKYRAELNQYNRKKGTYGNGDGKDASHKGGKIVGFEKESTNRGRAEKSRLKKESVNEAKIAHSKGGYVEVGKWYLLNYGKWKDTVKVVSIDSKGMKVYNPNDNWRYTIPMTMIKKKKIGGYMTPIDESVNEAVKFDSIQPKDTIDYGYAQYYVAKNDGKNIHMGLVAKKKATGGMFASDAKLSKSNFDSQIRVKFIKRVLRNGKPLKESVNEKISKEEWSEYPKYARKLKPYMRRLLKIPVKVRVIKQANHNPWIDVRVARSGKDVIPNDFRKRALKVIGGGRARDMDNINYGNIRTGSVSLKYDEWVKLLGNKVK